MPLPAYPVRANVPSSLNLAHGPRVPDNYDVYPTIDDRHRVAHMEGRNVPGTNNNTTETE